MVYEKSSNKTFPVVDLQPVLAQYKIEDCSSNDFRNDPNVRQVADKLANTFVKWGFAYLVNHGVNETLINDSFTQSRQFFVQDIECKSKFARTGDLGYEGIGVERFDKSKPGDLKECFNFLPSFIAHGKVDSYVPNFTATATNLHNSCKKLSFLLMYLLDLNLPVESSFLANQHKYVSDIDKNESVSRFLYYPPIEDKEKVEEDQLRCGEHSDYGTFTLLLQDDAGGLQVVNPLGEYIDATPLPGTIVLNCADMLEIWSAGKFRSTRHRVVVPANLLRARQSFAFFLQPDNEVNISCLDGSDKFQPVNSYEYIWQKLNETYS